MKRLLALAALVGCNEPKTEFACTGNASCRDGELFGVCEENGFCSFEDTSCPEGRRYGAFAGDALGDECVVASAPAIGAWKSAMQLPADRYSVGLATDGTALYVAGGIAGPTPFDDMSIADVSSGTIASWTTGALLPEPRRSLALAAHDGFVYVIGGRADSDPMSPTVLSVAIDGTSWSATNSLPGGLRCLAAVQDGATVYVVGGKTGNQQGVSDVTIGTLDAGTATWRAGTPMITQRFCHGAAVAGGYLYAVGGAISGNNTTIVETAEVEFAKIESDGSLGPWQATTPLPAMRSHLTAVGNDHYLVAMGGHGNGVNNDVLVAHVNPDGTLGAWRSATPFVNDGGHRRAVRVGDQVFVVGSDTEVATLRPAPL